MINEPVQFETSAPEPETAQGFMAEKEEAAFKLRQRAEKRFLCEAVRAIFPESGRVDAGQLVRLTDAEIWHYGDAVRRVRNESDAK